MDNESLTFLLRGGHYNVSDRRARGIWPHAPLQFEDVAAYLAELITAGRWFPYEPKPHAIGEPVDEFGFIEKVNSDYFLYHAQRAHANDSLAMAESSTRAFSSAKDVARHYLKWSLNLPGDLDGWKVV
jgi:hypothetical protein